jgi:hypothetical protein
MSRVDAPSPGTINRGPCMVRNFPSSEIERIAGRLPKPGSTSPTPRIVDPASLLVTWIHQRNKLFLLQAR